DPLKTISRKAAGLQSYLASAERVFTLLDERSDVPERPHARPLGRASGAVTFRDVCFAYNTDHPVLRGVSFEVPPGARVAIAGTTSSVDVKTEAAILEAMARLMRGRTSFLITHRPSAIVGCDVRLQLEGGRLVEPRSLVGQAS